MAETTGQQSQLQQTRKRIQAARRERLLGERGAAEAELARLQEQMQIEIEHDTDEGDPTYERETAGGHPHH
jgi:hypothetical protein